jgi:DNA-binding Lrp family transcriptional regulator
MNNEIVRKAMRNKNLKQWEVAELIGISESTMVKRMRNELPKAEQEEIVRRIEAHVDNETEEYDNVPDFEVGEYIIYRNGERYELGRVKSVCKDGCFVAYNNGETGAKTHFEDMHKLMNAYTINSTNLGGAFFDGK